MAAAVDETENTAREASLQEADNDTATQSDENQKKSRRLKDPLNSRQASITYVASHQWRNVQGIVAARKLVIGERAKLLVGEDEQLSCQVIKFHERGPNAGTYRVISPPVAKCAVAFSSDVGKPVFVHTKEVTSDAPFGMAHCGILESASGSTASIIVGGNPMDVSAKSVRLQPAVYKYVARDRILRIPPNFPREYADCVISMCGMKPGSHTKLKCYRASMSEALKAAAKNTTRSQQQQSRTGFPVLFYPW